MEKLILIILTVLTLNAAGQNNFIGINGGISMTSVNPGIRTGTPPEVITSFIGGLSYEWIFKKQFSIGADILYNRFGYKKYYYMATESSPDNLYYEPIHYYYDYISLPIKTGVSLGDKFFGFLKIGIAPSYLIDAKLIIPAFDIQKEIVRNISDVPKFNMIGLVEIGSGFKFHDRFNIVSTLAYRQSLTSFHSNYFAEGITHYGLTLTVGLKYALTKR